MPEGHRRYGLKVSQGYRKFFKTHVEQVKKPLNIELLLGHDLGLQGSCYKPTEQEVLEDYLKAVPHLTIDDDNVTLQNKSQNLQRENPRTTFCH